MLIKDIGEFALIERFRRKIRTDSTVIKGSGDDCAVLKFDKKRYQLFTCDMIVEGVDFLPRDKPELIGRKALAISISDIAACGGIPRYCVVSLGMPKNTPVGSIDKILKGMINLAGKYNVNIVGGDLSRAKHLTIDVSMLGIVEKKYLCLRSGARIGDIIFVTGELGGSIRGKHLCFTPRLKEARFLVENFKVNSMIDLSDGLSQDLGHILEQSKAGAVIYEGLIPVSRQARNLEEALFMGEDFELLFTLSRKETKRFSKEDFSIFKPIGEIVEQKYGLRLVDKRNKEKIVRPGGFRHF
jgi:thiamine-monophosphate kinase